VYERPLTVVEGETTGSSSTRSLGTPGSRSTVGDTAMDALPTVRKQAERGDAQFGADPLPKCWRRRPG
jgi:hypothetical protein